MNSFEPQSRKEHKEEVNGLNAYRDIPQSFAFFASLRLFKSR